MDMLSRRFVKLQAEAKARRQQAADKHPDPPMVERFRRMLETYVDPAVTEALGITYRRVPNSSGGEQVVAEFDLPGKPTKAQYTIRLESLTDEPRWVIAQSNINLLRHVQSEDLQYNLLILHDEATKLF